MLPNLPLDVDNKQIRVGSRVAFGVDNGSTLLIATVWKITKCFVWMKSKPTDVRSWRRDFRRVVVLGDMK